MIRLFLPTLNALTQRHNRGIKLDHQGIVFGTMMNPVFFQKYCLINHNVHSLIKDKVLLKDIYYTL